MADVAALAELRDIGPDKLEAYAAWVAAVDFYLRNGFAQHRQLLLWEPPAA